MWTFMKAAPWTFVIGGLILVGAVVGVILGIKYKGFWKDRGLMVRDGKQLKWSLEDLPIGVWFDPAFPEFWITAYRWAREHINSKIGREIFTRGIVWDGMLGATFDPAKQITGHVMMLLGEEVGFMHPDHGVTQHRYDPATGRIGSAVVTLPPASVTVVEHARGIALHAILPVLGLDHDETQGSIMHPRLLARPQVITGEDEKLLRKLYGR
jgi:hypothetical protein